MEFTSLLDLAAPPGTRAAYIEIENTKTLFEVLIFLDDLYIKRRNREAYWPAIPNEPNANDNR
jgi:hypothetical protein